MTESAPILLLTTRRTSRHQTIYGGICANDCFESTLFEKGWNGWLLTDAPIAVQLVRHHTETCHLNTSRGSYWMVDGISHERDGDDHQSMAKLARNRFADLKFTPPRLVPLPCFVAGTAELRPCRYDLIIRVIPNSMLGFPDVRVELERMESLFPRAREHANKQRNQLEATRPFAELQLPVQLIQDHRRANGVLHLRNEEQPGVFRCRLYWSHNTIRPEAGQILQRTARRELRTKSFRQEANIAEILTITGVGTLQPEDAGSGIVSAEQDGHQLPIVCAACGEQFVPDRFTPEQLEVIDLWGWLWPMEKERSLLLKTQALYRQFPEAHGQIATKLAAVIRSKGASRKMLSGNLTFGQIPDPRPADYGQKLDRWTQGDQELRQFLETHSCDVDKRLEFVSQAAARWEEMLQGEIVTCPTCSDGPLALKSSHGW